MLASLQINDTQADNTRTEVPDIVKTRWLRNKKPNPIIEPLPGIRPGMVIDKEQLITVTSDGFTEEDLINHPDDDPRYSEEEHSDELQTPTSSEGWERVKVKGPPEFQKKVKDVLYRYRKRFSTTLPAEPAKVTPLDFEVNVEEWHRAVNTAPHRRQSIMKDLEIRKQVKTMMMAHVIQHSTSAKAWSQVLLTIKPNGKWRFCIDFRNLNKVISDIGWPLPRIQEMIERIGHTRPTRFGKIDLTNGYHQMPLAKRVQMHTAFKTADGLYEWTRVPMGLKNAAAYFQKAMVTEVLNKIVHHGCEIYLDDCIVHGTTDDDFLENLNTVLRCCEEHNIVLSPSKCEFGSEEIEILGHTVNQRGMHFDRSKLDKVLNFPLPTTGSQLLSFVCLCNFFRKHVRDIASLESPLRRVAETYKGTRKIPWTTPELKEVEAAFYTLQQEVGKCPKLFFYDETSPVFLIRTHAIMAWEHICIRRQPMAKNCQLDS